jgi:hypothetical protein
MATSLRILLLATSLAPTLPAAQVSLGARVSYAIPGGDAYEQSGFGTFKQSGLAKGLVPIQLDATWRVSPALSAGLYLAYGFGQAGGKLKELCATPGSSCDSPSVLRYGVQAAWAFSTEGAFDPWLGLAAGVESASFAVKSFVYGVIPGTPPTLLTADLKGTLRGWDAAVEGGADHRVTRSLALGPVLSVGVGQYRVEHVTLSDQGTVAGGGVESAKLHQWFTLGVRARFDL